MIPTIENEKVVFLLKAILNDECRHHAMLKDGFRNNRSW